MAGKPKDPDKTYSPAWGGPGRGGGPKKGQRPLLKPISLKVPPDVADWLRANTTNRNAWIVQAIREKMATEIN